MLFLEIPSKDYLLLVDLVVFRIIFYTYFVTMYYNYKGYTVIYIFGEYIKLHMKEIDHPALIQEWKLNLDTA